MTFLAVVAGLILGGVAGDIFGGDDERFLGVIAGGVIAWLLRRKAKAPAAARVEALENRVRELDDAVGLLRARLQRLEGTPTDAVAPEASDTPPLAMASDAAVADRPPGPLVTAQASDIPDRPSEPAPAGDTEAPALSDTWGTPPAETPAWITRTLAWFTGGHTVVRVGIVVLFFGVTFLLKFAYDQSKLPPEFRVGGPMLGGIVLAMAGWRVREKRPGYALALQGGAVGVMYLAVFSALRLHALVPPGFAFALLAMIAAFSAALALAQNAQSLAVLGVAGGFLAPVLASTGTGSHVALFGYYAVLNAGIVAIASRRAWRPLNLTGFAFTFVISALWGARAWRPELWSTTQPFLAVFYLMYVAIPTFFSRHAEARGDRALAGTLVFGLPIVAFGLQARMVAGYEHGAALSALAVAAIYVFAARHVLRRDGDDRSLLVTSFASLALLFATLTIPLALDTRWTSAAWALEGAALVWVGLRQSRLLPRLVGYALQLAAAIAFAGRPRDMTDGLPIANRDFPGFLFLAFAAGFSARQLHRYADSAKPWSGPSAQAPCSTAGCGGSPAACRKSRGRLRTPGRRSSTSSSSGARAQVCKPSVAASRGRPHDSSHSCTCRSPPSPSWRRRTTTTIRSAMWDSLPGRRRSPCTSGSCAATKQKRRAWCPGCTPQRCGSPSRLGVGNSTGSCGVSPKMRSTGRSRPRWSRPSPCSPVSRRSVHGSRGW